MQRGLKVQSSKTTSQCKARLRAALDAHRGFWLLVNVSHRLAFVPLAEEVPAALGFAHVLAGWPLSG